MPKTSTTYRVKGTQETLGHQPGDTFDAYLDPDQETTLIESGALERVRLPDSQSSAQSAQKQEQTGGNSTTGEEH
jgi:hypothetical protein